jgi:hypothetical protein
MLDLAFVLAAIGFFAVATAFTHGCEKLRQGGARD